MSHSTRITRLPSSYINKLLHAKKIQTLYMKLKILLCTTQPAIACSKLETTETFSMKYVQANNKDTRMIRNYVAGNVFALHNFLIDFRKIRVGQPRKVNKLNRCGITFKK